MVEPHMGKTAWKARARKLWKQELRPLLVMALVLFSIRSSLADWNDVPTGSMKPTILEGDRILINKVAYDLKVPFTTWRLAEWAEPQRGDIVVFYSPHDGTRLVKRVVGLPGDVMEMREEQLVINGAPVSYAPLPEAVSVQLAEQDRQGSLFATEQLGDRAHAVMAMPHRQAIRNFSATRVPEGTYFMMGDNRDDSFDSRYFGPVSRDRILGRASRVVVSLDKTRYWLPRPERWLQPLDRAPAR
jgi:signal peptidase I